MYREGMPPRMLTVPELDEHFQTGVPGQYSVYRDGESFELPRLTRAIAVDEVRRGPTRSDEVYHGILDAPGARIYA
jgi:hypothetical protein